VHRFMGWRSLVAVTLAALAGACVVVDDPNHCWNLDGDATCRELWKNPHAICSRCARGFNGCVEPPVEDACRAQPAESSSSESSSSGDPSDSEGSQGAADCRDASDCREFVERR
jgi:hypothetical protein